MSDRVVATGTKEDPHGIFVEINIGSTFPETVHEALTNNFAILLQTLIEELTSNYPGLNVVSAKVYEVELARKSKSSGGHSVH